jgi:hypothetical protein
VKPLAHRLKCAHLLGYGEMVSRWFLAPVFGVRIPVPQPVFIRGCDMDTATFILGLGVIIIGVLSLIVIKLPKFPGPPTDVEDEDPGREV